METGGQSNGNYSIYLQLSRDKHVGLYGLDLEGKGWFYFSSL